MGSQAPTNGGFEYPLLTSSGSLRLCHGFNVIRLRNFFFGWPGVLLIFHFCDPWPDIVSVNSLIGRRLMFSGLERSAHGRWKLVFEE